MKIDVKQLLDENNIKTWSIVLYSVDCPFYENGLCVLEESECTEEICPIRKIT